MKETGLYIDMPFCIARCAFCDFHVEGFRSRWAMQYLNALHQEIKQYAGHSGLKDHHFTTLYFGGGTPSLYSSEILADLILRCREQFQISDDAEITLEAHPATVNQNNLLQFLKGGINRLSLGIQSFSDKDLKRLGRHHTAKEADEGFYAARAAGFTNIAIDLIYGLPERSPEDWVQNLEHAIALSPDHISIYGLSIEAGTLFAKQEKAGQISLPSEETQIECYEIARAVLRNAGYVHYEISNFSLPDHACRHNLFYWNQNDVLSLGLAAHSYFNGERRENTHDIPSYIEKIGAGLSPCIEVEDMDTRQVEIDHVIFGLRKTEGIPFRDIENNPEFVKTTNHLIKKNLLQKKAGRIQLTPIGIHLADEVAIAYL